MSGSADVGAMVSVAFESLPGIKGFRHGVRLADNAVDNEDLVKDLMLLVRSAICEELRKAGLLPPLAECTEQPTASETG